IKMNENANFAQIIQTLQEKVSNSTSSSVLKKDLLDLKEWVAKDPERRPISREDMANPALLADLQRRLETLKRTAKAIDQGMGCALPTPSANTAEQAVKNMPPLKSGHLSLVSLAIAIKVINAEFRSLPSQLIELLRDGDLASRYGQVAKLYICNGFRPSVHVVYTARSDAAAALHQICASLPSELKFRISTEWVISGDMDCSLSCGNWDPAVGCTYITYSKLPTEQCVLVKLLSNTVVDPRSVPWQFLNALNCASKALASGKVVDTANSDRSSQLILLKSSAPLQDPRSIPLSKSVAESNATQATASTAAFVSMNLASASTTSTSLLSKLASAFVPKPMQPSSLTTATIPKPTVPTPASSSTTASASKLTPASSTTASASRSTPASTLKPTPASTSKPTPASTLKPTPASTLKPTPASKLKPTPASASRPTPASILKTTPASASTPTPASILKTTPASASTPTPASASTPTP
ncbi:hypothetical protein BOX15_Mlig023038g3, partial [Macrostomum lignano]